MCEKKGPLNVFFKCTICSMYQCWNKLIYPTPRKKRGSEVYNGEEIWTYSNEKKCFYVNL